MKKLLVTLVSITVSTSAFGPGMIVFNNRNLTNPNGEGVYNAPIHGDTVGATAQLFLVTEGAGSQTYIPLFPTQTFRAPPYNAYFAAAVAVEVPGKPIGTTGLQFVVRVWQGSSYEESMVRAESNLITVHQPLGGILPGGTTLDSTDLGGSDGLQSFTLAIPEPSTYVIFALGVVALLFRCSK